MNERRAHIPDFHLTGWSFDAILDCWEHNAQVAINKRKCWDKVVTVDDFNDYRTGGAGPLNAGRIIYPQWNWVHAQGVDAQEAKSRVCDLCKSSAEVISRFITQVGISKE